jgi:hypothetical protein
MDTIEQDRGRQLGPSYRGSDTDWEVSTEEIFWRSKDGIVLVIGKTKGESYWARRADNFVPGVFATLEEAKYALEDDSVDQRDAYYTDECWT